MSKLKSAPILNFITQSRLNFSRTYRTTFSLVFLCLLSISFPTSWVRAQISVASFDVPQIVVAGAVDPAAAQPSLPGNRLVRVTLNISAFIDATASHRVDELLYKIDGCDARCRVIDYWPKTEGFSAVDGTVGVERHNSNNTQLGLNLSATPPPLSKGDAVAQWEQKSSTIQRYQKRPDVQVMIASGSVRRGAGVYFSLRRTPIAVLDGCRDFHILMEVEPTWRSSILYLDLSARQLGTNGSGRVADSGEILAANRYQILVVDSADEEAIRLARKVWAAEGDLRYNAEVSLKSESKPLHVTVFKKVTDALEISSRTVPEGWLEEVIFDPRLTYPTGSLSHLPVNTRAKILAYQDAKRHFLGLNKSRGEAVVARND